MLKPTTSSVLQNSDVVNTSAGYDPKHFLEHKQLEIVRVEIHSILYNSTSITELFKNEQINNTLKNA